MAVLPTLQVFEQACALADKIINEFERFRCLIAVSRGACVRC